MEGKHSLEARKKMSETRKMLYKTGKLKHPRLNTKHSEDTKKLISLKKKKQMIENPELREKISIGVKKGMNNEIVKNKLRISRLGKKHSKETIKKIFKKNPKSKLELRFEYIAKKFNLPYRFVGNGELKIDKKVPDFVNEKKKVVIEVYYKKHKELLRRSLIEWKEERLNAFNKQGWIVLFFDENEVNEENILKVLGEKNYKSNV